jgi:hypothetical protein
MAGRVTFDGDEMPVTADELVLAVDVERSWGAVFRFSMSSTGEFFAELVETRQVSQGRWEEIGSGGAHGRWDTPWRRPAQASDGPCLDVMLSTWSSGDDPQTGECALVAVAGFAARPVAGIRVEHGADVRSVVPSNIGAFAVIALVGDSTVRLTPLGATGEACGETLDVPEPNW